ncbi:hypothetical protein PL263_18385 [Methylomonas sp. EFPC3]|uniref:hypothetical protein n=1 Tax=Methylomonas sp. EFPC3 TaxID=3021710 RepID=UPI002415B7A6|nr:hypothetical protein [Methylomonas sp. EFPC3]WFP50049.1 hypothetical protein PL263_18385 [Methylomonas sp. EFPC3]
MGFTNSLKISALALGLAAGTANAHGLPTPVSGDPYIATETDLSWSGGVGTATNGVLNNNTILAYHFDVTAAGSLDVYTNDHDDPYAFSSLYIYKKDDVGADWTLTHYSFEAPVSGPDNPDNIFGVHRTDYVDKDYVGRSDAGLRESFDLGSYIAFVVGSQGSVFGHSPFDSDPIPLGAKLSAGFTWSWTGDSSDLFNNADGFSDLTIKASPGSLAVAGPAVEPVPVPGAIWLMGSVLAGFGAFGRKKTIVA